ncbi:hypothetical protein BHM03_00009289 [Ensete ventricosum]|uniref:Uncharacterized protein n=1 Tax=Ensete ventricosum TaxID=4639 RepID=A0A445MCN8_ENSVE|nr:hypothetical protein BHM03_00009289 [Ensete ventricosum]
MQEQGTDASPIESPPRPDAALRAELESLRDSHRELRFRFAAAEESLAGLRIRDLDLSRALEQVSEERDSLRIKLIEAEVCAREEEEEEEASWARRWELSHLIEIFKARFDELVEERSRRDGVASGILDSMRSVRGCFGRIGGRISDENLEEDDGEKSNLEDAWEVLSKESRLICQIGVAVESKFTEYDKMRRKEHKELENSIVSLTEENRDISSLLRVALVEKEAAEKSLSKLKGSGGEQKLGAILQIAERGLQRVGFGFIRGVIAGESQPDQPSSSSVSATSDGSECEEEVISLVEELTAEIKEAGEEAARWREACELEVEAGKAAIVEREKEVKIHPLIYFLVALLREELRRTKSALDTANSKLSLKEKLAKTAMAAQAAAEATLQLADKRAAGLGERIEELTRQLEEEAEHGRRERTGVGRRVRYVCWPWQAFRVAPAARAGSRSRGRRRRMMLPEMEALLRFNI